MIVMEDPLGKKRSTETKELPKNPPSATSPTTGPESAVVGPSPASVPETPSIVETPSGPEISESSGLEQAAAESPTSPTSTATREPDAFDLHSGADPIRGPGSLGSDDH